MLNKIKETIETNNLIKENEHIIVGVSGGPDSVCLLHVLSSLRYEYRLTLTVVHVNHGLRGKDADNDQKYTEELCKTMGLNCYTFKKDIKKISKQKGLSEEEAGREERYKAFYEVKDKVNADKIAVAQNLNDQAETLLIRLLRGSGLDGLSAIDHIRENCVIRPILDISRAEIERYCEENNLNPQIDKTNLETKYTRNKIRLELIPYLKENFNSNIENTLWKTASILNEDKVFINNYVEEIARNIEIEEKAVAKINKTVFNREDIAIKKRLILYIADILLLRKDIGTVHLENAIKLINENNTSKGIDLPNGLRISVGYNEIIFTNINIKKDIEKYLYKLKLGILNIVPEINGNIKMKIIDNGIYEITKDQYTKMFNYDIIKNEIIVRNRRVGDVFTPLGFKGSKKIKNYFIDEKIDKDKREEIPIICCGDEIMWVVGYRISEKYKVTTETKQILVIEYNGRNKE